MNPDDLHVIACNYAVPRKMASQGSLAYVLADNPGNGDDYIQLLSRSRSGRWIEIWVAIKYLNHFRQKTIPSGHPLFSRLALAPQCPHYLASDRNPRNQAA